MNYVCVSSTDKQGGQKRTIPHSTKQPKHIQGKPSTKNEKPNRKTKAAIQDNPTYLAARVVKKSESREQATEHEEYVESRIGLNT